MSGVAGDVVQNGLSTVEVLIEESLFLDNSVIVDVGGSSVGFYSKLTSVSLTGFNPLLS
jgi:hypothetical protein